MMLMQQHFAFFLLTFELIQSAQRESNPRFRHGKTAGYRYITGAYQPIPPTRTTNTDSGSGGNRTHVHLLKRQAPRQRRTHFQKAVPRGFEPPLFSVTGRRPLHWPAGPCCQSAAGGGGIEPRRHWPSVLETECVPRRDHHL